MRSLSTGYVNRLLAGIELAKLDTNPYFRYTEMVGKITPGQNCCPGRVRVGYGQAGIIAFLLFILTGAGQSFAQPRASLKPSSQVVPLNRSVHVALTLTWVGEADVYDIPQPDLSGLPKFKLVEMELSATRRGNENHLRYELVMESLEEGEYDLDRMRVEYYEKGKDVPTSVPLHRATVRVISPELLGGRVKLAIAGGVVLAVVAVAAILIIRYRKKSFRRGLDKSDIAEQVRGGLLAELTAARSLLIETPVCCGLIAKREASFGSWRKA
jgi:hypothetical protein